MKLTLLLISCLSSLALDITRHDITWTITGSPVNGTYANGDPWVVGPIEITAISPAPTATRNGTMINPKSGSSSRQGFDSRPVPPGGTTTYLSALNVGQTLPLAVAANTSVVSSKSLADGHTYSFIEIESYSILTVVSISPAAGSFRPPPYTNITSKASLWTTNDINWSALNTLDRSVLSSVPSVSTVRAKLEKYWYEQDTTSVGRLIHTPYMGRYQDADALGDGYGKDIAYTLGHACLLLNLDFTNDEKFELLIRMIQQGIDTYGLILDGSAFGSNAGHSNGRLAPMIVAGWVLGSTDIKSACTAAENKFSEYRQTFYVTATDVAQKHYTRDGRDRDLYQDGDIGKPEFGSQHYQQPNRDGNAWDVEYRDIAGANYAAPALVAQVMDAKTYLGADDAFFAYTKRHIYYRVSRYTDPAYYNGYDDGIAYGTNTGHDSDLDGDGYIEPGTAEDTRPGPFTGNTKAAPFSSNDIDGFSRSFFLTYENATLPGAGGTPPDAPASISATATSASSVAVSWANVDDETGFKLERKTGVGGTYSQIATPSADELNYADSGLADSTTYYYRVRATNASGDSAYSPEVSVTTLAPNDPPPPTETTVNARGTARVRR